MMGQGFGAAIAKGNALRLIVVFVISFLFGLILSMWAIPALWECLKPFIHSITC